MDTENTLGSNQGQDSLSGDNSKEQTDSGKVENELQQKLTQANQQAAAAQVYARMMQDPDFAAVAQAKAAGKKIKVVSADSEGSGERSLVDELVPNETPPDLDNMSNKDLVKHLMRENVKLMTQVVDQKLNPLSEAVQGLQQATVLETKEKKVQELNQVRQRFPDFDKHLDKIIALSDSNPKLNPMQLYVLVKTEAGEQILEPRQLQSERPSNTVTRPPTRTTRKTPLQPGILGLRELVREAAARLPASGILEEGFDD